MRSHASRVYFETQAGTPMEPPRAGSTLEHPLVFDRAAKNLKAMADKGLVAIVDEHSSVRLGATLIDRLTFVKLR